MTRETKIGLLVGLAFIIVIGILLSDHLTSSTEPPLATLVGAGANVRQTTTVPGGPQAPITPEVRPPQVEPQETVPTRRDLQPPVNPTSVVQVSGPGATQQPIQQQQQITIAQPQAAGQQTNPPITMVEPPAQPQQAPQQMQQSQQVAGADAPDSGTVGSPTGELAQVAQQHGEALETVSPSGQHQTIRPQSGHNASTASQPQQTSNATAAKEYTAQPGDTVSKMAARMMGANTKSNREAIVRANPSLHDDPNKVIVGRSYRIPAGAAEPAPVPAQQQPSPRQAAAGITNTEYWYTVKEGDSLWKIANDQLGNPSAVASIKELNKDLLKGGDVVMVGQKLRLPGKPVAQAD